MLKIAKLDNEDILAIAPEEIRVRLSISDPVELQTKDVRLALKLEHFDGSQSEYQYLLQIIDVKVINAISSWFSSQPLKHSYQFKLAPLSQLEFSKYQLNYVKQGKPKRYYWSVYYYLKPTKKKKLSTKIDEANIDMELKLANNDEYFYLLKDAPIDIN